MNILRELQLSDDEDTLLQECYTQKETSEGSDSEDNVEDYFNYFHTQILTVDSQTSNNSQLKEIKSIFNKLGIDPKSIKSDRRTTLMIKNIPSEYTVRDLSTIIDRDFKGKYDYLHMPYDNQKTGNQGYAFINLLTTEYVLEFYNKFNQRKMENKIQDIILLFYYKLTKTIRQNYSLGKTVKCLLLVSSFSQQLLKAMQ
ncbi:hypothetical protein pb186bvf_019715 [Paramecium bursaria]